MMKEYIENLLQHVVNEFKTQQLISDDDVSVRVEPTKNNKHGDFSTNLAMVLAKKAGLAPMVLASKIMALIPEVSLIKHKEIAPPGFINFFIQDGARGTAVLEQVLLQGSQYGTSTMGEGKRVLLEYVSANPTGPLHVGHGRSAAFGASLANLLKAASFTVTREYYVNDAGRQMDILAVSVWVRYLAFSMESVPFPANGYQGDYVKTIAEKIYLQHPKTYVHPWSVIAEALPLDLPQGGDKEIYIDALIQRAKQLLGDSGFSVFHQTALEYVLADIQEDLALFGVEYDNWFSERGLHDSGAIDKALEILKRSEYTFEQDGALWFRSTAFGDEKDRVLVRANGEPTYFAPDVAYHWNKYQRGYDKIIDLFGADHHGYIPRLKAAISALGHDEAALQVFIVQFAILYREGSRLQMSTRSGSFVTLRELREEVGLDAARFFYVMRKPEQHMDFDLDLAKSQSRDNPVYYIQYAHARISSVFRQLEAKQMTWDKERGLQQASLLTDAHELALLAHIERYPSLIEVAAHACEPHQIAYYLRELANALHAYYNAVPLLCPDEGLRWARLTLLFAVREVLKNGLSILGVSAPEQM